LDINPRPREPMKASESSGFFIRKVIIERPC
jgi:hypothetical protein